MAGLLARPTRYPELKAHLADLLDARGIAEPSAAAGPSSRPADEHLVQLIWHEQFLHADRLRTLSGKPLRVVDPGEWNGAGGPDFRFAELEIAGRRMRGDVEIHVESADWERHRHDRDLEYDGVILHAFLARNDPPNTDRRHNGDAVERLEIGPVLNPDLETAARALLDEEYTREATARLGRCQPVVAGLDAGFLRDLFREAARERMETKIARAAVQRASDSPDQVLYQGLMTTLGHRGAKTLYYLLARRAPIAEMAEYLRNVGDTELPEAVEAILLNVAGLTALPGKPRGRHQADPVPEACEGVMLDGDTQEYLNRLQRHWAVVAGYFTDRLIPPTKRWFTGMRPASFPQRRLAGMARVLAAARFREGLVAGLVGRVESAMKRGPKTARDFRREVGALATLFESETPGYWSLRFTLGGKVAPRPSRLIGTDVASSALFNGFFPALVLHARENDRADIEAFAWRLFDHFPALPDNAVTRYMRHRLFGPAQQPPVDFRFEKNHQALLHIFGDCCGNNALTCDDCSLLKRARGR